MSDDALLADLQRHTFDYFLHEANPENGLVEDNTRQDAHASIAVVGLGLACFPVAVERGYLSRAKAVERVLATLRFFWQSDQREAPEATGCRGFHYHFLHMDSGRRAWESALSTIDSTFLISGALLAAQHSSASGGRSSSTSRSSGFCSWTGSSVSWGRY